MKILQDILYRTGATEIIGPLNKVVPGITFDSRKVEQGWLFVAVKGTQVDGHQYISEVIENGASIIVCENLPKNQLPEITYVAVNNSSLALGFIAANFYDNPSEKLNLVGVTGTNGKTTTVTLLHKLFTALGYQAGLLSTIATKVGNKSLTATHTTPDAIAINELLAQMVAEGCEFAFMEVSSHAVHQNRISGLKFAGGVFSNITHDHLDYHKTFAEYIAAKKRFFDELPSQGFALSNIDDKNGKVMLQNTRAKKFTYGLKSMADFKGKILENHFDGLQMLVDESEFYSPLTGEFNAYNLMAIYATAILLKQNKLDVLTEMSSLQGVEGRFDIIRSKGGITCFVDYAHTPDALLNVLKTINDIRTHNEQLITVVGAGGDRDRAKRPKMALIASKLSNTVILTSDNPRSEEPAAIIGEMYAGIDPAKTGKTLKITDRREAIKTAVNLAQKGDLILVAGKGHEKYQEIRGVKHHFDDKEILNELLENL
jgi:UDP-N-acetylmuramoyl-L-alanyl-D-glutamate--2,6-diaminopimelate ligase